MYLPNYEQIFKANGELLTKTIFDDVGNSSEGMISIRRGKLFGFVNSDGKIIVEPKFLAVDSFSEGLAAVAEKTSSGTKLGFIDKTGKIVIPARFPLSKFDIISGHLPFGSRFTGGLSMIQVGEKFGYLKHSADWLIKPRFDQAHPFSDGRAAVCEYTKSNEKTRGLADD